MHDFSFHFDSVNFNAIHPYTLIFIGICTGSNGGKVIIEYTGAGITMKFGTVPLNILPQLQDAFEDEYGYGPFN